MRLDRPALFAALRPSLFAGRIGPAQVEGVEAILDAFEAGAGSDPRHLAYGLATAFHETARTMQPIREAGGAERFRRLYDIAGERPEVARRLGNLAPGDGERFHGRGFVQLTGRRNYALASGRLGVDLVARPDAALEPRLSAAILVRGMSEGWFTGRSLSDFFHDAADDPVGARRIVNGTDRARLIAAHHRAVLSAVLAASPRAPAARPSRLARALGLLRSILAPSRRSPSP